MPKLDFTIHCHCQAVKSKNLLFKNVKYIKLGMFLAQYAMQCIICNAMLKSDRKA